MSVGNEIYVDNYSPITWIRPQLGVSDLSTINFGTVQPNTTPANSAARTIYNSQTLTGYDQVGGNIASILYAAPT